jgi:glycosyltransferase involved in cell wall biosynthesis
MILFITNHAPYSGHEKFAMDEYLQLKKFAESVKLLPFNPKGKIIHKFPISIKDDVITCSLRNPLIYLGGFIGIFAHLRKNVSLMPEIWHDSPDVMTIFKNIIALLKANHYLLFYNRKQLKFVYSFMINAPASFGYFISVISEVPFGVSAHRGDIEVKNMLKAKTKHACFVRTISKIGKERICNYTGYTDNEINIITIPLGVEVTPANRNTKQLNTSKLILFPALFYPVKGHKYAVEAIELLSKKRKDFILLCAGDGPVFKEIRKMIHSKSLDNYIQLLGLIPNEQLQEIMRDADIVILPSINDDYGNHEGIPVALMEAMALRKPVISTNTGGIPELLGNGAGLLIAEKDPVALCESINELLNNEQLRQQIADTGFRRVSNDFNITENANRVYQLIKNCITH